MDVNSSALLAVRFLGEKLNLLGKIGCLLTISGSVILVIHAPKDSEVNSSVDFAQKIQSFGRRREISSKSNFLFQNFFSSLPSPASPCSV